MLDTIYIPISVKYLVQKYNLLHLFDFSRTTGRFNIYLPTLNSDEFQYVELMFSNPHISLVILKEKSFGFFINKYDIKKIPLLYNKLDYEIYNTKTSKFTTVNNVSKQGCMLFNIEAKDILDIHNEIIILIPRIICIANTNNTINNNLLNGLYISINLFHRESVNKDEILSQLGNLIGFLGLEIE